MLLKTTCNSDRKIATDFFGNYFKGARYLLIIHELLVAMGFFPMGVQDETLKEESQRLVIAVTIMILT